MKINDDAPKFAHSNNVACSHTSRNISWEYPDTSLEYTSSMTYFNIASRSQLEINSLLIAFRFYSPFIRALNILLSIDY